MQLHIAKFEDGMYPSDNKILGICMSEEEAEKAITDEIEFQKSISSNPSGLHSCNRFYYSIEEHDLKIPDKLQTTIDNLYAIAKLVTIKQAVTLIDIESMVGLNPYCINEGRATGNEKLDLYKIRKVLLEHEILTE